VKSDIPPTTNELLINLTNVLTIINNETVALREEYQEETKRTARRSRKTTFLNIVLVLLLVVLLAVGGGIILIGRQLADCTVNKSGKCYIEGAKRSAAAVNDITHRQYYIIECARIYPNEQGPAFDVKFERCVDERVAKGRP
jgi:hypothetical protein